MSESPFAFFASRVIDTRNSNAKRAHGAREIKESGRALKGSPSVANQAGRSKFRPRLRRASFLYGRLPKTAALFGRLQRADPLAPAKKE
jgi:hypothetical protein